MTLAEAVARVPAVWPEGAHDFRSAAALAAAAGYGRSLVERETSLVNVGALALALGSRPVIHELRPDALELEVRSFADFEAFLLDLGAGPSRESAREQTRAWWAELYREMQAPGFRPQIVALGRLPELGKTVTLIGVRK